jgi:hypothetical protein
MNFFSGLLGVLGIGAAVLGTVAGFLKSSDAADNLEKASKARERAETIAAKRADLTARRQKIQQIRQARIKKGAAISRAQTSGALNRGSSVYGGIGSIQSQAGGNLSFLNKATNLNLQARAQLSQSTLFSNQAQQDANTASIFRGVGSLGGTIFSNRSDIVKVTQQVFS